MSIRAPALAAVAMVCALLAPALAQAHRPLPRLFGHAGPRLAAYQAAPPATSGTWTPLVNTFPGGSPDTALLMTDGTVMVYNYCSRLWYRLSPDLLGNYVKGAWRGMAAMPSAYRPEYFASQVLPDGRVLMMGGEYNGASCDQVETNLGALYDPFHNSWTSVPAPSGWTEIGDGPSVILPNGHFMIASCCDSVLAAIATIDRYPGTGVTWATTGQMKADAYAEEGWTLMANGQVFTGDVSGALGADTPAETYAYLTGDWSAIATAPKILVDPTAAEIGPAIRLASGKIFQVGANPCGKNGCVGHTAIYDPAKGTWGTGPSFPAISGAGYDSDDGPAAILPNGNVLIQASPAYACKDSSNQPSPYCAPSHFFEFNGISLVRVNEPATAPDVAAYTGRMLVLPNGHVLWTSYTEVEDYQPVGTPNAAWAPTISTAPATLVRGQTKYRVTGTKFKGVSNGAAYGDDAQMNTNFPLVRLTSRVNGHVCFGLVHDFTAGQTLFDMPAVTPAHWVQPCVAGAASLQVIVNGIASAASDVIVQ